MRPNLRVHGHRIEPGFGVDVDLRGGGRKLHARGVEQRRATCPRARDQLAGHRIAVTRPHHNRTAPIVVRVGIAGERTVVVIPRVHVAPLRAARLASRAQIEQVRIIGGERVLVRNHLDVERTRRTTLPVVGQHRSRQRPFQPRIAADTRQSQHAVRNRQRPRGRILTGPRNQKPRRTFRERPHIHGRLPLAARAGSMRRPARIRQRHNIQVHVAGRRRVRSLP